MTTEKEKFLREFNEAFVAGDVDFVAESITDDIQSHMVGDQLLEGKDAVVQRLNSMDAEKHHDLTIDKIITHGKTASVNGVITVESKKIHFCDVYEFNSFKNPKIKKLTAYVIEE
ncbi:nuclear transport factor 2 family protein [Halalkalibacillus sediminis]|nr:nuclear transport factor 2 family protein [Halalkalibacillus sediminis]